MKKSGLRWIGLLGLLAIMLMSQVMFSGLFSNSGNSTSRTRNGLNQTNISASAANENVQLVGASQVVRLLSRNQSISIANTSASNNLTFSAIPAASSDLFTFQSDIKFSKASFSTNDTIENFTGFDYPYHASDWINTTNTAMLTPAITLVTGSTFGSSNPKYLNYGITQHAVPYGNPLTPWQINSAGNKVRVNITYTEAGGNISYPQAIRDDFLLSFQVTQAVSLDIYMLDNHNSGGWVKVTTAPIQYTSTTSQYINQIIKAIDKHSQALRLNKNISVSYVFSASSSFTLSFYKALVQIYQAREIPINAGSWVALSFDLRGPATVQGFSMWIRSLDLSSHENLIMTLFKTNNSAITYDQINATGSATSNTDAFHQQPGTKIPISIPAIVDYNNDSVNYFKLPSPLSLSTGNYFIVLNSSKVSGTRYSLVTLAWNDDLIPSYSTILPAYSSRDPNNQRKHTVAFSTSSGLTWYPVKNITFGVHYVLGVPVTWYREVNAAPFKVKLTRGLVPSDLNMTINGTAIKNWTLNPTIPYSGSNFAWGRGYWNQTGLSIAAISGKYKLGMTWNSTVMGNFIYNATAQLIAYANDPGMTICRISRNAPAWEVNYNFSRTAYANWAAYAINLTYPADWVMVNLTYPDLVNHYNSSRVWKLNSYQLFYGINETMITAILPSKYQQGPYTAWFTSPNYLKSVTTYLQCNSTTYYPVTQYSKGDAMSARVAVQSKSGKPVFNGAVNMTVFSPTSSYAFKASSNVINSTAGFVTSYHFNEATLHVFNNTDLIGQYLARTFWFNGSEVGNAYPYIYNVNYAVSEFSAKELPDQGVDWLYGSFTTGANQSIPTNIVHVALDTSKKVPLNINVSQTIGDLVFETFNQSETVFNPGETVHFGFDIKSNSLVFQHSVKVQVRVIQALQPDRIIMNASTAAPFVLNYTGGVNAEHVFTINANFPTGNAGFNAPLRHALLETRVQLYVDGLLASTWLSNKTYAVKMDNSSIDGTVLGVAMNTNQTGRVFSQTFNRVNQTVFNKPTTFMLLLESSDGVTLTTNLFRNLTNTMSSKFENITVAPITGDVFAVNNRMTITVNLSLENGALFRTTTNISVMKNSSQTWVPYNSVTGTNALPVSNGSFTATFLLPGLYTRNFSVALNWSGFSTTIAKTSTIIVINLTNYNATAKIIPYSNVIDVYGGNVKNFYSFIVQNTGNTTLMFDSFINITGVTWRNATWINNGILNLAPGSEFSFTVDFSAKDPGFGKNPVLNITIILHAYSIETKNPVNVIQSFPATQRSQDIASRLGAIWYVGYFAIIGILALLALVLIVQVLRQSRMPAGPGALAKGKMAGKEGEKPYIVKKGADLGKEKPSKEKGSEKKYRPIEEAMKEIKGDEGSKANVSSKNEKVGKTEEKVTEDEDSEA